jgi:hypothetical protein
MFGVGFYFRNGNDGHLALHAAARPARMMRYQPIGTDGLKTSWKELLPCSLCGKRATCQDQWSKLGEQPRSSSEQHRNQLARTPGIPSSLASPSNTRLESSEEVPNFVFNCSTCPFKPTERKTGEEFNPALVARDSRQHVNGTHLTFDVRITSRWTHTPYYSSTVPIQTMPFPATNGTVLCSAHLTSNTGVEPDRRNALQD